jgi:tetratricopeptide (TPR) repeat protein
MRALEHDPDYGPALYNLAMLYDRELNDPYKAATFYRRYLEQAENGSHRKDAREAFERLYRQQALDDEEVLAVPQPEPEPSEASSAPTFEELLSTAAEAAALQEKDKALALSLQAAEIARQRRDNKAREKALRTAIDLCAEHAEAHEAWGQYCLERARYVPALQSFKRARILDPKSLSAHLGLAEAATETGEYDAALITLRQARRLDPNHAESLWALATLYDEHLGVSERAVDAYLEFNRRFPNDARIVRAQDRLAKLQSAPTPQTAENPKPPPPSKPVEVQQPEQPAPKPVPKTRTSSGSRDLSVAIQAYNRGTTYQQRGEWDQALYYYTRAIENDRNFATAYYNLGTVYKEKGELDASRDAYVKAVQLQPKLVNARYNLALVYTDLKQTSAAIEQLRTVLRINSRHAPSHYVLGLLYARNPQAESLARQHYEKYVKLAPNDPSATLARKWLAAHPARVR